jgi:hypothetical protein
MQAPPSTAPKPRPTDEDGGFDQLLARLRGHFAAIAETDRPLFRTDAADLFVAFLDNLPPALRQHYTCHACRHFLTRFGGLAVVGEDGQISSAVWPAPESVPEAFTKAVEALRRRTEQAQITGVFLTADSTLGTPLTGEWNHLALTVPAARRHRGLVLNAAQLAAEKGQDLLTLKRGLDEFPAATAMTALEHLTTGGLYRSEKAEGVIHWLLGLHEMRASVQSERARENLLWVAAAQAPAGFCHIRSGVVGTLLEDITAGLPFDAIKARWADKMAPSQYMRAQAAPAAGNIAQAEKIIATLKAAGALERRYARLDDVQHFLWRAPREPARAPGGIFAHLTPKARAPVKEGRATSPQAMTWEEFQRTVLPEALGIEAQVPASPDRFMALVTAARPDAPPILQWDSEEARNPVSWYYAAGIDAEIKRRVLQAGGTHEGCDIRASLLWNNRNDLDLHVVTAGNEHIYFGAKRSGCGGWLDVDMNVRGETETPVENIRWTRGAAKAGRYQIYVQNYRFHEPSQSPTPFRLELEVSGEVYHCDAVISPARQTGAASNVVVTEFLFHPGQKLAEAPRGMRSAQANGAWNVTPGQWVRVTGIVPSPNLWGERPLAQHGRHVFFLLEGCRDMARGVGRGFFTETLRSEFHPIRSTLDAYAAAAVIAGAEDAGACGIGMSDQAPWGLMLRVRTASAVSTYLIERWK